MNLKKWLNLNNENRSKKRLLFILAGAALIIILVLLFSRTEENKRRLLPVSGKTGSGRLNLPVKSSFKQAPVSEYLVMLIDISQSMPITFRQSADWKEAMTETKDGLKIILENGKQPDTNIWDIYGKIPAVFQNKRFRASAVMYIGVPGEKPPYFNFRSFSEYQPEELVNYFPLTKNEYNALFTYLSLGKAAALLNIPAGIKQNDIIYLLTISDEQEDRIEDLSDINWIDTIEKSNDNFTSEKCFAAYYKKNRNLRLRIDKCKSKINR